MRGGQRLHCSDLLAYEGCTGIAGGKPVKIAHYGWDPPGAVVPFSSNISRSRLSGRVPPESVLPLSSIRYPRIRELPRSTVCNPTALMWRWEIGGNERRAQRIRLRLIVWLAIDGL